MYSLWEVPDKPTRALFTRFYEEIFLKKRPRGEALRDVIKELARRSIRLTPVEWGLVRTAYGDIDVLTRHHPVRRLNIVWSFWTVVSHRKSHWPAGGRSHCGGNPL